MFWHLALGPQMPMTSRHSFLSGGGGTKSQLVFGWGWWGVYPVSSTNNDVFQPLFEKRESEDERVRMREGACRGRWRVRMRGPMEEGGTSALTFLN